MTDAERGDRVGQSSPGLKRSPAREFGHCRNGYAVEFNFAGFACRSLTVETKSEAETIRRMIEDRDGTSGVQVVLDE